MAMEKLTNLLIVAGAGRNVGKTEFVCRLIARLAGEQEVYGLKVSAIHPDEGMHHGDHSTDLAAPSLFEETRFDLDKDTSRMLRAGARKVYYLQGDDKQIRTGFTHLQQIIPRSAPIVCESGSLWKYVQPGLLVLVTSATVETKPRARKIGEHASLIVESDGLSGFSQLELINYSDVHGWWYES